MSSNSLPAITSMEQLLPALQIWRQTIQPAISTPSPPRSPFNFRATSGSGSVGIVLNWDLVSGADGYIIQTSPNGDFSNATTLAQISNGAQTSFFDNTPATGTKKYYKIASTAGTISQPQSVTGIYSAPISITSGSGGTSFDNTSGSSGTDGWNQGPRGRQDF